jgi:glycerol-3-phosphate dehydrogenase (NAD(P)+)
MTKIAVLGDGAWGTALALVLSRAGKPVTIWSKFPEYAREMRERRENFKYLPGAPLGEGVEVAWGPPPFADVYVSAVPTQFVRETFRELGPRLARKAPVVSVSKGLEQTTGKRPSEVLREVLGRVRVSVLAGPSHAPEVARGLPASVVAAGPGAREVQKLFAGSTVRVYTSRDALGVELGGALKNVIALAGGICDGLALGHNAKAAVLTRGIVEMARLGVKLGARRQTFFGLSGIGDLITTTTFPHGRNLSVGRALGEGKKLEEILGSMNSVVEGVWTTRAAFALGRRLRVDLPITSELHAVLFDGKAPRDALRDLLAREPRRESD